MPLLMFMRASGIIPTRMGTSIALCAGVAVVLDHPHAYGDKLLATMIVLNIIGSSPRVWGQASKFKSETSASRIIPTRMGTSNIKDNYTVNGKDHPHAYGDKTFITALGERLSGSSPRVWGQA